MCHTILEWNLIPASIAESFKAHLACHPQRDQPWSGSPTHSQHTPEKSSSSSSSVWLNTNSPCRLLLRVTIFSMGNHGPDLPQDWLSGLSSAAHHCVGYAHDICVDQGQMRWGPGFPCVEHGAPDTWVVGSSSGGDGEILGVRIP